MKIEWAIYFAILIGTFLGVLVITGNHLGALIATSGAVLAATHAAAMTERKKRLHAHREKHQS